MNIQDFFMQYNRAYGLGPYQIQYDDLGTNQLIYVGFAPKGVATSASLWWIVKIAYSDATGNPTSELTAPVNSIWDNRTSLTYS